jgi:hypothetical protein
MNTAQQRLRTQRLAGAGFDSPALDGRVAGTWARRIEADAVTITLKPFTKLSSAKARLVAREGARYATFIGRPARIV